MPQVPPNLKLIPNLSGHLGYSSCVKCSLFTIKYYIFTQGESGEFIVPYDAELECKQHVIVYDGNTQTLKEDSKILTLQYHSNHEINL